jgi:hypothetical protein
LKCVETSKEISLAELRIVPKYAFQEYLQNWKKRWSDVRKVEESTWKGTKLVDS